MHLYTPNKKYDQNPPSNFGDGTLGQTDIAFRLSVRVITSFCLWTHKMSIFMSSAYKFMYGKGH